MDAALDHARLVWRELGFEPDTAGFTTWVARAIAVGDDEPAATGDAAHLRVSREGDWLEVDGTRHSLATRRPLRRILVALAEARCARGGTVLAVTELLRVGWPGEDPLPDAGANRVYVAVSTLRRLGLGTRLQHRDGGYRLDPEVPCTFD
jgi:hypothetical protein